MPMFIMSHLYLHLASVFMYLAKVRIIRAVCTFLLDLESNVSESKNALWAIIGFLFISLIRMFYS